MSLGYAIGRVQTKNKVNAEIEMRRIFANREFRSVIRTGLPINV